MESTYRCKICGGSDSRVVVENIRDWEYGFSGSYEYRECSNCASIQIHPFPSINDLIESYKVDYHGFAGPGQKGVMYAFFYKMSERAASIKLKSIAHMQSNVLDVGCGIGLFLRQLKNMGFTRIEGIDFSERAVNAVKEAGILCHKTTFIDFKKEDHAYDLIVMNNYLEHTLNPLDELKKARRLLKNKGSIYGEVPNFGSFDRFLFGRYWGGNHVPRHTFQFNDMNLKRLLLQAGFTNVTISYPLNTSHFALSIQNLFQRNCSDLKNNRALVHGRDKHYSMFMVSLIPVNAVCALFKRTGFMKFYASW